MSLLTGTTAASIMLEAGVGVLRTLPAPEPSAVEQLRRTAATLGVAWPDGASAAQVLSGLPRDTAPALALRRAASTLLRGAGYAAFDRAAGTAPPPDPGHGGIGAPYAHVTAPLRRLVDRFGTEVCLAVTAGAAPPEWLGAALPALPSVMAESDALAGRVERACIDRTEAALLASRVGAEFEAVVLRGSGLEDEPGEVFIADPPVLARCTGVPRAGEVVRVELVEADPAIGRIAFRAR
jgi:exoribonuclease R